MQAELPELEEPGRVLRGRSLDVVPAAGRRIVRPDGDFTADPAEPEFDEPQACRHAWRALEYFRSLTDPPLLAAAPFATMRVVVRDPGSPDNAYYSPSPGDVHFGLFGVRSSARDASVVIHELGHAVTDAISRLGRSFSRNTEARGLSEGFSDYFAASLLDDPRLGPFIAGDPDGARNASDPGVARLPRAVEHVRGGPDGAAHRRPPALRRLARRGDRRGVRHPGAGRLARLWSVHADVVHQRGGVLGLDRRVLVRDNTIEVIDKGRSRGRRSLAPSEAERLGALAESAAGAGAGDLDPARSATTCARRSRSTACASPCARATGRLPRSGP